MHADAQKKLVVVLVSVEIKASPAHSTAALIIDEPEETDPWDLPELKDTGIPWSGEDSPFIIVQILHYQRARNCLIKKDKTVLSICAHGQ